MDALIKCSGWATTTAEPAHVSLIRQAIHYATLSVSVFAIGISLSQLLIGPLSDALGRKNLLLTVTPEQKKALLRAPFFITTDLLQAYLT
ncbi:hypothetical protein DK870_03335 [Pseudomonas sp. Q1]|nr:hypothetical protein [Pseudomonas sp. Q1]